MGILMKFTVVCAVLTCGLSTAAPSVTGNSNEYYEKKFNESIQCVRRHLYKGIPRYGIPPCDPFNSDSYLLKLDDKILQTDLTLTKLLIKGLLDFDVVALNVTSDLRLFVNYHWKIVKISSLHEGYINLLGLMGILADGEVDLEISDVKVTTETQYNVEPPLIQDYNIKITVGSVKLNMTGLASDEAFSRVISELISRSTPLLINFFHKEVTKVVSPIVKEMLNARLGHYYFLEFLAFIVNWNCEFK